MARIIASIVFMAMAALPVRAQNVPFAAPPGLNVAPTNETVANLGDIMGKIQFRHIKLWFAIENRNWPLVNYEIEQTRDSFVSAVILYRNIPVELISAADQALALIQEAAKSQDVAKSERAYASLTTSCNSCHQAAQVGFIRMQPPRTSPFSDQKF